MIYSLSLNIPANTSLIKPVTQQINITYGVIHQIEIEFPSGCAGLVGIRIVRGVHQLFPSNPSGEFIGDSAYISFKENYPIYSEPFLLTVIGVNADDLYNHTIQVRIGLLRDYTKKATTWADLV